MYSFPYPRSSDIPPIKVPYVALCKYSLSGSYNFENFSDHAINILSGLAGQSKTNHGASIIQSWLFFGLASEALGRDIEHEEFLERSNKDGHTKTLIDIRISAWFWIELGKRLEHLQVTLPKDEFLRERGKVFDCFAYSCTWLYALDYLLEWDEKNEFDDTLELVFLSVHMLHSVIADVLRFPSDSQSTATGPMRRSTQVLLNRMVNNGWCRKRLNFINATAISYPCLYFLSSIAPAHGKSTNHARCTFAACSVSTDIQVPLHRTAGCRCQDIPVSTEQIIQILQKNGLPLVRIKKTEGVLELEVVEYTVGTVYTAISHVWSDRQFGSKKNALPRCQLEQLHSILAELPVPFEHWGFLEKFGSWQSKPKLMKGAHRGDWLFWLDTFCVPQDDAHEDLKRKAMNMMDLVYGNAAQTLVLDAAMQDFDAGQQPSSMCETGPSHFFGPANERLLDTLAHLFGSNWMGRAWTLQEGVLSARHSVFHFRGSFAIIGHLHKLVEQLRYDMLRDPSKVRSIIAATISVLFGINLFATPSFYQEHDREPLTGAMANDLLRILKASLDIQPLQDYPRRPAERAAKFIYAHSNLQSRSTTKLEDLPLILVNLSGLNGNYFSQISGTDEKMRSLIYALGSVPVELLYSSCCRIGGDTPPVDSWIPREVVPEKFSGKHLLHLSQKGFIFQRSEDSEPYKFFLISSFYLRTVRFVFSYHDEKTNGKVLYRVEALAAAAHKSAVTTEADVCVLVGKFVGADPLRGALFLVTGIDRERVFLRYIRPLRLWEINDSQTSSKLDENREDVFFGRPAAPQQKFILERSSPAQALDDPRPQNPAQYNSRIDFLTFVVFPALCHWTAYHRWNLCIWVFNSSTIAFVAVLLQGFVACCLFEWAVRKMSRHAWIAAHQPSWTPHGRWNLLWKFLNFPSPISMKTFGKTGATLLFVQSVIINRYEGVLIATVYWLPLFDRKQLGKLYIWALLYKAGKHLGVF